MNRKNKLGFAFNLVFVITLIILGLLCLLCARLIYSHQFYYDWAWVFLAFAVSFLTTGIIQIVFLIRNKNGEYPTIPIAFNTFLLNVTILIAMIAVLIINVFRGNFATVLLALFSPFIIILSLIPTVLVLLTFRRKIQTITKLIFMVTSAFLSLLSIFLLITFFLSLEIWYAVIMLIAFLFLEITFGIYLIISINKIMKEDETTDTPQFNGTLKEE